MLLKMSCSPRSSSNSITSTDVHVLGYDCTETWLFFVILIATFFIKLLQNKIWAKLGQAQRLALQFTKGKEREPYVWSIVQLEAISTTLGIVSIILILGTNVWVLLVIVVGNLYGVKRTYSQLKKDSHSTAHDLLDMLHQHKMHPNPNTKKFLCQLLECLEHAEKTPVYTDQPTDVVRGFQF